MRTLVLLIPILYICCKVMPFARDKRSDFSCQCCLFISSCSKSTATALNHKQYSQHNPVCDLVPFKIQKSSRKIRQKSSRKKRPMFVEGICSLHSLVSGTGSIDVQVSAQFGNRRLGTNLVWSAQICSAWGGGGGGQSRGRALSGPQQGRPDNTWLNRITALTRQTEKRNTDSESTWPSSGCRAPHARAGSGGAWVDFLRAHNSPVSTFFVNNKNLCFVHTVPPPTVCWPFDWNSLKKIERMINSAPCSRGKIYQGHLYFQDPLFSPDQRRSVLYMCLLHLNLHTEMSRRLCIN